RHPRRRTQTSRGPPRSTGAAMGNWTIEPLAKGHERGAFSCGHTTLDDFLKKYAGQYARRKLGTTYVAVAEGQPRVLGYYTLAPSRFEFANAPAELLLLRISFPRHRKSTTWLAEPAQQSTI